MTPAADITCHCTIRNKTAPFVGSEKGSKALTVSRDPQSVLQSVSMTPERRSTLTGSAPLVLPGVSFNVRRQK